MRKEEEDKKMTHAMPDHLNPICALNSYNRVIQPFCAFDGGRVYSLCIWTNGLDGPGTGPTTTSSASFFLFQMVCPSPLEEKQRQRFLLFVGGGCCRCIHIQERTTLLKRRKRRKRIKENAAVYLYKEIIMTARWSRIIWSVNCVLSGFLTSHGIQMRGLCAPSNDSSLSLLFSLSLSV